VHFKIVADNNIKYTIDQFIILFDKAF